MEDTLTIRARVLHVRYSSQHWCSVSFENMDNAETFTAVGDIPSPHVNKFYTLTGVWTVHSTYGPQFSVSSCVSEEPENDNAKADLNKDAVVRFLASDFIKGLGYKKACLVYDKFGKNTLRIIEKTPLRLQEVPGIGSATAQKIHDSYKENKHYWELRSFLKDTVTDYQIKLIYQKYKQNTVTTIKSDPYKLIDDISGIGFSKADTIALAAGIAKDAPCRIRGAVVYLLQKASMEGHCFSYIQTLSENMEELIGQHPDIYTLTADAIKELQDEGRIHVESDGAVYLHRLWMAETSVADDIKRLLYCKKTQYSVSESQLSTALRGISSTIGFEMEATQESAVRFVYKNLLSFITGGPGTGKTTIIKAILYIWLRQHPLDTVLLMAPTGKAARRITEITGIRAYTIHQCMKKDKRDIGLVIVDEGSMIDIEVAAMLLRDLASGTRVIIIGDVDQLPPVGPGNFFRDALSCYIIPSIRLKVSFRQHGSIATNATRANEGKGPHSFVQDNSFHFYNVNREDAQKLAIQSYLTLVGKYGVENVCLLTPTRKKGMLCTTTLNGLLQDIVNPPAPEKAELATAYMTFRLGDRVICNENLWDVDIANGDTGTITDISAFDQIITAEFDSGVMTHFTRDMVPKLSLAYSLTIHKSQGSEYKGTVVACTTEHWYMVQRNLLYTGMTRAKDEVYLIGDARTIAHATSKCEPIFRNTRLKERLLSVA